MWVPIHTVHGINLLIGNYNFSPDTKPQITTDYSRLPRSVLERNNSRVVSLGDFSATGFDWASVSSLPNCHYYSNITGDAMYTSYTYPVRVIT